MTAIIIAVVVVTIIGIICAVVLSVASKVMYVPVDERVTQLSEVLPGANSGGCGFPGCDVYAAALVEDPDTPLTLCAAGGAACAQAMAAILGKEAGEMVEKRAFVACTGDCSKTKNKMEYVGIDSCKAAKVLFGGAGSCTFGCMGLGDCVSACVNGGVSVKDGLVRIDYSICNGCGGCAKVCPNSVIKILPADTPAFVTCSNKDKGAVARKKCTDACIGCGMCMRKCPNGAIKLENNLAVIDYEKCNGCGTCIEVCPAKCIV